MNVFLASNIPHFHLQILANISGKFFSFKFQKLKYTFCQTFCILLEQFWIFGNFHKMLHTLLWPQAHLWSTKNPQKTSMSPGLMIRYVTKRKHSAQCASKDKDSAKTPTSFFGWWWLMHCLKKERPKNRWKRHLEKVEQWRFTVFF